MTKRSEGDGRPGIRTDTGPHSILWEWLLDADISDRAVRLYGVLGRYADRRGEAWPSRQTLAKRLRCSRDTVDRAVKELVDLGALEVEQRFAEGEGEPRQTTNLYVLHSLPRGGRKDAQGEGGRDAQPPLGMDAAQNESQNEREPEGRKISSALARGQAPKLTKIADRDICFDALAKACEVAEGSPRARDVAMALNGDRRTGRRALGIRDQFWREIGGSNASLEDAEMFERWLASTIPDRANLYRSVLPHATLTPFALQKWWTDLPNLARMKQASSQEAFEIVLNALGGQQ